MKRIGIMGLIVLAALCAALPAAAAESSFFRLLSPKFGKMKFLGGYEGTYWGQADVKDTNTSFDMQEHDLALQGPLWQDGRNELALGFTADVRVIDSDLILPEVNTQMPDNLWDINLGLSYRRKINEKWIGGLRASFGSPSDEPFDSDNELAYNGVAFARYNIDDQQGMFFMLFYSNITSFLPGIGYLYSNKDRSLDLMVGVPLLFVTYKPIEPVTLQLIYYPVRNIYANAQYSFNKQWAVFARYTWSYQDYFLANRPREENRLFYYEMRGVGGISYAPIPQLSLELCAGYAFERMMFQGENYGDEDQDKVELDSSFVIKFSISTKF